MKKRIIKKISTLLDDMNSDINITKSTGSKVYIYFNIFSNGEDHFLFIRTSRDIFNLFIKDSLEHINLTSFNECLPNEEEIFELCSFLYKI